MKINIKSDSRCNNCNRPYNFTKEMYDIMFIDSKYTICKECCELLFSKLLKADCMYNQKLKSSDDLSRVERSKRYKIEKKL